MDKVVWDESISVGVRHLDDQHKELISHLNLLIDYQDLPADSEKIDDILNKMMEYSKYHFKSEEELMIEYNYPDYKVHKDEHEIFVEKTTDFCFGSIAGRRAIPKEMLDFLLDWLENHILTVDMKYKNFFNKQGVF